MKSFLSLERPATFICRKNGIERMYLVYEGTEFVKYDLLYEKPTTEPDGVTAEINISPTERTAFIEKSYQKLAYYDTAVLIIHGTVIKNNIMRHDLFQTSSLNKNSVLHISLKDVYYSIDYEALGIRPISVPVAIRLHLSDGIIPTPSRESYITNEKTKTLLLEKIKQIATYFVEEYNKTMKPFATLQEAWNFIYVPNPTIHIGGVNIGLNAISHYSLTPVQKAPIQGVTMKSPDYYKGARSILCNNYSEVAWIKYSGIVKTKRFYMSVEVHAIPNAGKVVVVNDQFIGNVRDYFKHKYSSDTLFVKLLKPRSLGNYKSLNHTLPEFDDTCYYSILGLNRVKKELWRGLIKEFELVSKSITSKFIDECNVTSKPEYIKWLDDKRELQKQRRKQGKLLGTYNGLNKKLGDVTIAYSYKRYRNVHFKKEALPVANLLKNKYLTVMVEQDNSSAILEEIIDSMAPQTTVKFAKIGKLEMKKLQDSPQFIKFKSFMTRDCKPFMRLASSIKFKEAVNQFEKLKNYKSNVFQNLLKSVIADKDALDKYILSNFDSNKMSDSTENIITDVADEYNLYDKSIWDAYERLKDATKKYNFITLFNVPSFYANAETVKEYETAIYQMLLFRKKYYDDLPRGFKVIYEEPLPVVTEEELETI